MNDPVSGEGAECNCDGMGKILHQSGTESTILVLLDELIEVDRHKFEDNTHMASEEETVFYVNNICSVGMIFLKKLLQNFNFSLGLLQEPWIISHNLQCSILLRFVIINLQNLSKGSFP